jgi:acetyl-CoA synthetase
VVLRPGATTTEADLLAFGERHLAGYKRPKRIHLVTDYPRTKNGKVIRAQLKRQIESSAQGGPA